LIDKGFRPGFNDCLMCLAKVNILHGDKDQNIIPGFKARTPEFCLTMPSNARENINL